MGSGESGKKILLIAPPFYRLMGSHYNGLHLGICYIAAVLKQHGHEVKVYNADYSDTTEYSNQRQLFENYPFIRRLLMTSLILSGKKSEAKSPTLPRILLV